MEYLRLFWLFVKTSIQNDTEYRADFFGQILVTLIGMGTQLAGVAVIFTHTPNLAGWNLPQVLALLGVYNFMSGVIGALIAPNMRQVLEDIRQGTLDFALLKPVDSQFLVSARQFVVWRLADVVLGLGLAVYATLQLSQTLSVWQAISFVLLLCCGAVIVYSFWLLLTTTGFWFTRLENLEMIWWNLYESGRYPIDVYPIAIRNFLTFAVPIAFVTTIPARALAHGVDGGTFALAVLLAAGLALLSAWFWRVGLRRYGSASS